MRIALAQINSVLGDFAANKAKILEYVQKARERHCDLVVFPESALFGYHPVDLLEMPALVEAQEKVLKDLHREIPKGMAVLVGAITKNQSKKGKAFWNAAVLLQKGVKAQVFAKQLLPTYDVFDEGRHIEPGQVAKNYFRFKGKKFLVTICEDIWAWPLKGKPWFSSYGKNPLQALKKGSADIVLNLSASPFTQTKLKNRLSVVQQTAKHFGCPMIYVNLVGAQDELIFDGGSFVVNKKGQVISQCVRFSEDINVYDTEKNIGGSRELSSNPMEIVRSALVLGIRDFLAKVGANKVLFGLSGGIDSALVACLAVDALGPMNVTAVLMPGPFTSDESIQLARDLAKRLGIRLLEVPINDLYRDALAGLDQSLGKMQFGVTHENLQARMRGLVLMGVSNQEQSLLLGTTNKSELAVGYGTMYGDMIGALMPIGDMLKTEVYEMSRYYNSENELIPKRLIERPPTAELRANQKDQDSLPPYEELDEIIKRLVVGFHAPKSELERKVFAMMMKSEFKRWQSPPVLKVSDHAFGRGRRFPVAHRATL